MENLRLITLLLFIIGVSSTKARATEIQWATGCASFETSDVLSVSYNTNTQVITLYRTQPSPQRHSVSHYTSRNRIEDWPRISFEGFNRYGQQDVIQVEFETKATMYTNFEGNQIRYQCDYYSFDVD